MKYGVVNIVLIGSVKLWFHYQHHIISNTEEYILFLRPREHKWDLFC